ncbi:unnamed protein product [Rhizoctonia solani]|uniref:Uncharacterized protein n=1 Tax=Rhizoctonia solani TaxID=456999 RepID=A0A8H3CPM8_9AGAM
MATIDIYSSTNTHKTKGNSKDGTRFKLAAPEKLMLPGEKTPFIRIIDAFVFLVRGQPVSLPKGWEGNESWANVHLVGAVANLSGSATPLAQCGWFHMIPWRWLHITTILKVEIRKDTRFRRGEICFWLTTPLGDYVLLSPHKGYSLQWSNTVRDLNQDKHTPIFRRMVPEDPVPTWWDSTWETKWPPIAPSDAVTSVKRPITAMTKGTNSSTSPKVLRVEGCCVRRKRQSGDDIPHELHECPHKVHSGASSAAGTSAQPDSYDFNPDISLPGPQL